MFFNTGKIISLWFLKKREIHRVSNFVNINWNQYYVWMCKEWKFAWILEWAEEIYVKISDLWFDSVWEIFFDQKKGWYYYIAIKDHNNIEILLTKSDMKDIYIKVEKLINATKHINKLVEQIEELDKQKNNIIKEIEYINSEYIINKKREDVEFINSKILNIISKLQKEKLVIDTINYEKDNLLKEYYKQVKYNIEQVKYKYNT